MCLHNLLQEIEVLVLLLSVSVTVKVLGPTWNITLPSYSNFMPEVNKIFHLEFCTYANYVLLQ